MSPAELDFAPEPVPSTLDPRASPPGSAEVVVVGGGVVGASAAYHLARAGMRPLVIEADRLPRGAHRLSVGLALAGLSGHVPRVTRLVQGSGGRSILDYTRRSLDMLEAWDAELPGGIEWDRFGSLHLATDEAEEADIRRAAAMQSAEGLEVRIVEGAELADLAPGLAMSQVRAATWTPRDARLNALRLCSGLLEAVRGMGGSVLTGVRVERLVARSGRVAGVATSHGDVPAGAVLLAGDALAPALAAHLAAHLAPMRETVCVTEVLPFSIGRPGFETDHGDERWSQTRSGEVLIGSVAVLDAPVSIASRPPPSAVPPLLARLHPALAAARVVRSWVAIRTVASLEIPMAGRLPAEDGTPLPGAFVLTGLGPHGPAYAPVLGRLIAELISGGEATTLSLEPFDPRRHIGARHRPGSIPPS